MLLLDQWKCHLHFEVQHHPDFSKGCITCPFILGDINSLYGSVLINTKHLAETSLPQEFSGLQVVRHLVTEQRCGNHIVSFDVIAIILFQIFTFVYNNIVEMFMKLLFTVSYLVITDAMTYIFFKYFLGLQPTTINHKYCWKRQI